MTDYAITVKVRNGRIKRRIAECGFKSVNALCVHAGLHATEVCSLLNFKISPLQRNGQWRQVVISLADALGCDPSDLFSEQQRTLALKKNETEKFISEKEFLSLTDESHVLREVNRLTDPVIEECEPDAMKTLILRALGELDIDELAKEMLMDFFGLDDRNEKSIETIAKELGFSVQGVRNIIEKVVKKFDFPAGKYNRHLQLAYGYRFS